MLLLLVGFASTPYPALDDWMEARGFPGNAVNGQEAGVTNIMYKPAPNLIPNPPRRDEVFIVFQTYSSPLNGKFPVVSGDLAGERNGQFAAPGDFGFKQGLESGLPLGTDAWRLASDPSARKLRFRTRWMRGDVLVLTWDGVVKNPLDLAEGAARQLVALVEARRLETSSRQILGETSISTWRIGDGPAFADLAAWAVARGWTAKLDEDRQVRTLAKGAHSLVVPLGAASVRVDDTWKDLPDVVMLKDGKWWVPLDALEAAAKG